MVLMIFDQVMKAKALFGDVVSGGDRDWYMRGQKPEGGDGDGHPVSNDFSIFFFLW